MRRKTRPEPCDHTAYVFTIIILAALSLGLMIVQAVDNAKIERDNIIVPKQSQTYIPLTPNSNHGVVVLNLSNPIEAQIFSEVNRVMVQLKSMEVLE